VSTDHSASQEDGRADNVNAQERRQKAGQIRYFDEVTDSESEIERPACYPKPLRHLLKYKMDSALDLLGSNLEGKQVMVACCGSGMDAEFIAKRGARVYALDLSLQAVLRAVERSHRHKITLSGIVGDAENIPFRSGAFHYAIVHDGLHHIPDPMRGVRELIRVAAVAALIVEPASTVFTRLAVRLGLSHDHEEAGNYVFRIRPEDLEPVFREQGVRGWRFRQDFIYYQPWTFRALKYFESSPLFCAFRLFFYVSNLVLGRWGNSLKAVAWK
jgi:SAM-dependent methyltransferase